MLSSFFKRNIYKILRISLVLIIVNIFSNNILAQNTIDYKKFEQIIIKAEKYFKAKDYKNAKKEYNEALKINPGAQFPKNRIEQINKIYVDPEVENAYNNSIKNADILLNAKKYQDAINEYKKASDIKPEKNYPKNKIKEINNIINAQKALQKKYNNFIKRGDNFFNTNNYTFAKTEYENASKIFPDKKYPKNKLIEIKKILTEYNKILSNYLKEINKADEYYISKDFENAKIYYQNAIKIRKGIKPDDKYAQNMLIKINDLIKNQTENKNSYDDIIANADILFDKKEYNAAKLGYQKALTILPDKKYPKDKINEINKLIVEIDNTYNFLISKGDSLFAKKEYFDALVCFQKAETTKNNEEYPKKKISEINSLITKKEKEKQNIYNNYIKQGDSCFADNNYEEALTAFENANKIFPDKEYSKNKIEEINNFIADKKQKQEQYENLITQADNFFSLDELEKAKQEYQNANDIKPDEQYPKDKISEINNILSEKENKNKKYQRLLAEADELFKNKEYKNAIQKYHEARKLNPDDNFATEKISEIKNIVIAENKTKLERLKNHLTKAENYFNEGDYENSKAEYLNAYKLSSDDKSIAKRITEINEILEKKMLEHKRLYKKAIGEADSYYNQRIYDLAVDAYEKVLKISEGDAYSLNQIKKIKKILIDNSFGNLCKSEIIINNNKLKKFNFKPISPGLRKNNYIIIKICPLSDKTKIFVNYGEDTEKSGGVVFKTNKKNITVEKIIRISTQDKWFRNDNNWLTLYPEGGDIKISFIQISNGD
ncbi:MAG: hypothetical protein J7J86_01060 [Bacteroidales bacterium]|nr:hypothetical protein [Bacteroidales bacterium]